MDVHRRIAADERRADTRYPTDATACLVVAGQSHPCRLCDISAGGAMIEDAPTLELGAELRLSFAEFENLSARVVHVGHDFYGVQFLQAGRHREAILHWIRTRGRR